VINKKIAILGSTGSVGTQALSVVKEFPDLFEVTVLTADSNAELLIEQAKAFLPKHVVICNEQYYNTVKDALHPYGIEVSAGEDALSEAVQIPEIDVVLTALVGFVGLKPTLNAIKAGKDIALANKETLVVAGELIMRMAKQYGVRILPVDSEHSAIFQCLAGEDRNPIEKIILTASGGPFRGKDKLFLETVTPALALSHPTYDMGKKISIDSATLMNKGLEVIEAFWLFDLEISQIDVVVHPQSVIHSMVQFEDGSIKAQMGIPDMKLPIQVALAFPKRIKNSFQRFDFTQYPELTFEKPNLEVFTNLSLAYKALAEGGVSPTVLNAANEIVVAAFLKEEIGFLAMSDIIGNTLAKISNIEKPELDDLFDIDQRSRSIAKEMVLNKNILFHNKH
jgi:1-deoxy-D-xylulose-5-phosphate reductoisomerase